METGVSIMDIEDIKWREISILLQLSKTRSVRELARQRNCPAGQISKIIHSLENKLGFKLIERSALGIKLTHRAKEVLPHFAEIQKNQEALIKNFQDSKESPQLGIATTSFFSTHFIPQLIHQFHNQYSDYKVRLLDLPPDLFMPVAMRDGFQVCLHLRELDWPKTWSSQIVGEMPWILCCRKNHPLAREKNIRAIYKYPFVSPVYWSQDGLSYGNDNFPSEQKRLRGVETSTATSGVEIISLTNEIGFVPALVAAPALEQGRIEQLHFSSLKKVSQPIYLSVKSDQISQKMYAWFTDTCKKFFA